MDDFEDENNWIIRGTCMKLIGANSIPEVFLLPLIIGFEPNNWLSPCAEVNWIELEINLVTREERPENW